jgi:PhnB protein
MHLHPYLFFTTKCERALDFYTECGLGKTISKVSHGEYGMPLSCEAMRGKILHAEFEGPGLHFFASDNDDAEPMKGFALIVFLGDRQVTRSLFERLASGGLITTVLGEQPWGAFYGKLTDRFGVQWMLNCDSKV